MQITFQNKGISLLFHADDEKHEDSSDDFSDVTIDIRELDDVLMKDVGNKIADSGKYVIVL